MKNWLAAAGRFLSSFILVLILLVGIAVLGIGPGRRDLADVVSAIIGEIARLLPLAAIAAVFLSAQSFKRKGRLGIIGLASLVFFGFALLAGGFSLRRFAAIEQSTEAATMPPPVDVIMEVKGGSLYIGELAGSTARSVLVFRNEGEPPPRLVHAQESEYSATASSLDLRGGRFDIGEKARKRVGFVEQFPDLKGRFLNRRLSAIDALPLPEAAVALLAFSLLAASLAGLGSLARWSLVGLFLSGAGFIILLAVDGGLAAPLVRDFLGGLAMNLGLPLPSFELLAGGIEGFLALIMGTMVLAAKPKEME